MLPLPSGTVTFLFTDIEGSTRLLQELGQTYAKLLRQHHAVLRTAIQEWHGVEVDTQGDAFFVAFSRAADAIRAVEAMQRTLGSQSWPEGVTVRVRMALHTGEPALTEVGYVGMDVHRAARICSAGHGGQVLLSGATQSLIAADLPEGTSLRTLGAYRLKDLQRPEPVFQLVMQGLEADFPPLRSLDNLPNNLPLQNTSFIGREAEMARVETTLEHARLVTLTGPGGAGKTRLSLQVGASLLDKFPDGVWLIELAALTDPSLVVKAAASILHVNEDPRHPLTERLCERLRQQAVLLIFDNCEHLVAAAAELIDTLLKAAPLLKVLATSREILAVPGERVITVPPLSLPGDGAARQPESLARFEAVRLFLDRATAWQPAFSLNERNASAVARICAALDGIPLALELAAARVRSMSVEQIASRLYDRFNLLTAGSRTLLPRQQTLTAAIDWSYDLLSASEQVLFRRLAVFSGGWTLEAAEQVCSAIPLQPAEVLDLLSRLVDKSLVVFEQLEVASRYHFLGTMREYALLKLQASGEMESQQEVHFQAYYHMALEKEPLINSAKGITALDMLERDHNNLRAALAWGFTSHQAQQAADLAAALGYFWLSRGHAREANDWMEQAYAISQSAPTHLKARTLYALGLARWQLNDYVFALSLYEQALALYESLDDPAGCAEVRHMLGHVELDLGRHAEARQYFERSTELCRQLNQSALLETLLGDLGLVAYLAGDFAQADSRSQEQLHLALQSGNRDNLAMAYDRLGDLARCAGDFTRAESYYQESRRAISDTGIDRLTPSLKHNLAHVRREGGHVDEALGLFHQALEDFRSGEDPKGVLECMEGIAETLAAKGDLVPAAHLFGQAELLRRNGQVQWWPANRLAYERWLRVLREALPPEELERAWQAGKGLSLEQALEMAGPEAT
jgi:predicted ATPase/class 3 adenylate cyclase